jgi:hypothetical protein
MEQDRDIERCRAFEDSEEVWMIEVPIPDPPAEHDAFEAERPDAAFQLERRRIRRGDRQCRQRLEAVGPSHHGFSHGIVSTARQIDVFRVEIMQRRRGQRQDLNIETGLVHECDPLAGEVEQVALDLLRMHASAGVRCGQIDRVPGGAHAFCQVMLLYTDQLHACLRIARDVSRGYHGTVSPWRSMKRKPGVPACTRSVSTSCGTVSSTLKVA